MKNNPLKILFLFAHLHKGGMQRAVCNITKALPDNHKLLVGYFGTENPNFEFNAIMHDFNIPGKLPTGPAGKFINFIRRISAIRSYITEQQIDVVISFGEAANILNLASRHSGKKIISLRVAIEEGLQGIGWYKHVYLFLARLLYPFADAVVTVSCDLARWVKDHIPKIHNLTTIPNMYHLEEMQQMATVPLPEAYQFLENKSFVLNVGTLCHQKGQDDLLRSFAQINECCPELYLVILGEGELRVQLEDLARSLGIQDQVIFLDFDPNPYRYMARASVFVLTSRFEGFPNALVEAMICGCPIIAFDCPTGPSEIIGRNEYGILLEDRSESRMAQEISSLLSDSVYRTQLREKALAGAERYSPRLIIGKWQKVIRDVTVPRGKH